MLQERPFAYLPAYIAAARARGRPTRLVLRNSDRIRVVHLYFQQGRLIQVEGHRGTGAASLADLANWQGGTIRQDDLGNQPIAGEPDPQLEVTLGGALLQLETLGVINRASPLASDPRVPAIGTSQPGLSAVPSTPSYGASGMGMPGLPPLPAPPLSEAMTARTPTAPTAPTAPSRSGAGEAPWQLLARFVYQIVERAEREIPPAIAVGMLMQAVSRLSTSSSAAPVMSCVEVDEAGWLRPRQEGALARFSLFDLTQSIAQLITDYQTRCAQHVGHENARKIITDAAEPYRLALKSLGLDISAG
jgi:hypothetical protein